MIEIEFHNHSISKCYISKEEMIKAHFENDLAILDIEAVDILGVNTFKIKTIVRRLINSDTNEAFKYEIASSNELVFFNKNVRSIKRMNNHFIIEIAIMDENDKEKYCEYRLFDYMNQDKLPTLKERGKIPGGQKATMNEDLVVINPDNGKVCLFSLSRCDIASQEYSMIDDIDGTSFLITDIISTSDPSDNKDHLIFRINCDDKRTSKVYSRMERDYTDDDIDYPYVLIKERKIAELNSQNKKEAEKKYELRKGNS